MAEDALKKLEEQLNCSICLDTYTNPKLLQCFHVYCRQCLVPLVVRDQKGQLGLTCPTCRQVTPIPERGVAGLQSAFHINHLLDIQKSFRMVENPISTVEEATPTDAISVHVKKVNHCTIHEGKELELYCETCGELVCYKCAFRGGKHRDHNCEELYQAFEKYKVEVTSALDPMEKQVVTIKKALAQLTACCGEISKQQAATEELIHITFGRLREALNSRESKLVDQLQQITKDKLKSLAIQMDQIETGLAQTSSCLHFMKESLRKGNEGDVLTMKTNIVKQVKELTTSFQTDTLKPNTEADIVFSAVDDMSVACHNYGQILSPGLPDPSKCHLTGNGTEEAVVSELSTAVLRAINFGGQPCEQAIQLWEGELVSEITGTRTSCAVERRGQSIYEMSYKPIVKGRHQLHIKAEGQNIRGSPFNVIVKSQVETLDIPILSLGGVAKPWGVVITQRGEVVVTEHGGHCVSVFSSSGEKLRSIGTCGSGKGQFWYPRGVAVDGEGNILVADCWNDRIQKFTAEGHFFTPVGTSGSEPLQFNLPTDIVFSASNNKVYVADSNNNRVHILNSDLSFSSTFGTKGTSRGHFNSPWGIACDSTGKVYVADSDNHRVQVFTAEGRFLSMFGQRGQARGELHGPVGIAINTGRVYVSEGDNHRVSVFNVQHKFVFSFGRKGAAPGQFDVPCGLVVDDSWVTYVCDRENNRVLVF